MAKRFWTGDPDRGDWDNSGGNWSLTPENPRSQVEARNVTPAPEPARSSHSTVDPGESQERYRLMRLCPCAYCGGTARDPDNPRDNRCPECRGEASTLSEVGTAATPEALGLMIVTLAREGELEECPIGIIDNEGEVGLKWLVRPWLPSPRNISDAGRVLQSAKQGKGKPA